METKNINQGETLKNLISEHNPSRELLAQHMGITSAYLYKLYKEKKIKTVYFVLACEYMQVDPKPYISSESSIASFLKKGESKQDDYKKIIEAQDETLKMYRINKQQEDRIQQLEEELAIYKKRDTKAS